MSTRSQKRKAARQEGEEEELQIQDQDLQRVRSVELGESDVCGMCTSTSVPTGQKFGEFDELKTSSRKAIAEEIKVFFAQSKKLSYKP